MKKLRIVNKLKFIEAISITALILIESTMLIHRINISGILWFFTT